MMNPPSSMMAKALFLLVCGWALRAAVGEPPMVMAPAVEALTSADAAHQDQPEEPLLPDLAQGVGQTVTVERLIDQIPDPVLNKEDLLARLEEARERDESATAANIQRSLELSDTIRRPRQIRLTLEDVIRRTLANNYTIEMVSYNPAIETTRVIEAQAAFDAAFFTNIRRDKIDQPSAVALAATSRDGVDIESGIRKLLPLGTQISGSYRFVRTRQEFGTTNFNLINPSYTSQFVLDIRQPVLRNAGIDYNRSLILLRNHDRRISDLTFRRQVRDTLREVEELYWRLIQARRDVVITARELADFEGIYKYLDARKDFDITPVQIAATKADLELARADFVQRRANVFDAADRLIAAMNDPELNLANEAELIPQDFPVLERVLLDRIAEVQVALDHRTEIREQQIRVASAKIAVGRAKNAELPRFDATFQVTHDGLSETADRSFDEVTRRKFISYVIGVEFEIPVGNRAPRAARRRAELQHGQAIAQLKQTFENIILDVNLAVRQVDTTFDRIVPTYDSVAARQREVESIVARAERKDHNTLISELGARRGLASTRRAMLQTLVDYNVALIDLERAKGTLPEYNNVIIPTEQPYSEID